MLRVFISHSHEEKELALAWQVLLEHVSQGAIEVWLSSDTKPFGGMKIGEEWRNSIYKKLSDADYVIAIISPKSIDRPWILWECGVASGTRKERGLIPVIYSMPLGDFDGPISSYQAYSGEDKGKIVEICERLLVEAKLTPKTQYWEPILETYINTVRLHRPPRNASANAIALWTRRIDTYLSSGRESELPSLADSMYSSLGSENAIDIQIHELLSQAFLEMKSFQLALSEVTKALEMLPDDLGLHHRKSLILLELGRYDDVKEHLEFIFMDFPEAKYLPEIAGIEGRLNRELFERSNRIEELDSAISAYEIAYQKDPYRYYSGVNAVTLKLMAGRDSEAKELAVQVLSACKDLAVTGKVSFWLDFTIGELNLVLGNTEDAYEAYCNGMSREPAPKERQRESALKGIKRVFSRIDVSTDTVERFEKLFG